MTDAREHTGSAEPTVEIGTFRAMLPSLRIVPFGGADETLACYPFPRLESAGEPEIQDAEAIAIQSDALRVTIAPGLGGRIAQVQDVRSGDVLLPDPQSWTLAESIRGPIVAGGIEFGSDRLDSCGSCCSRPHPSGAVLLSGTLVPQDVRWTACVSIEEAGIRIEIQLFNRSLLPCRAKWKIAPRGANSGLFVVPEHPDEHTLWPRETRRLDVSLSRIPSESQLGEPTSGLEESLLSALAPDALGQEAEFFRAVQSGTAFVISAGPLRAASAVHSGICFIKSGRLESARACFLSAVECDPHDPLAWWALAATGRHLGATDDFNLTNAHALSPLEPVLAAEAALAAGAESPLPTMLAEDSDALLDALSTLKQHGFVGDMFQLAERSLKLKECALVRLMLGATHLESSGMRAEAAMHVSKAAQFPLEPPFPWREAEVQAVRKLNVAFPADERLQALVRLCDRAPLVRLGHVNQD